MNESPLADGAPITNGKLYDLSMIKAISGTDSSFVDKMLKLLLDTMPQNLNELKQAQELQNWDQVGKIAHKLKSTIDSLGISSLKEKIRELESNGKQSLSDSIPAQVDHVIEIMNQCLSQIKKDYVL